MGWTVARTQVNTLLRTTVLWRYATATDPASWTFSIPTAVTPTMTGAISTYRSTTGATPIAVSASLTSVASTTHPLPQVTTTTDAQHLVHAIGFSGNTTATAPASTTQRANVPAEATLLVADRYQSRAGASTPASATSSLTLASASITVAIVPLTSVVRLGYERHDDNSTFMDNTSGVRIGAAIALPGNTTYVLASGGWSYSHANIHGDAVTVTNLSGARVWTGFTGPYGEPTTGTAPPNTIAAGTSWRWHGKDHRLTDRSIVQMGARPYSPAHGRFLGVDPIEGGCANDYSYVYGDPVNHSDLDGKFLKKLVCGVKAVAQAAPAVGKGILDGLAGKPPSADRQTGSLIGVGAAFLGAALLIAAYAPPTRVAVTVASVAAAVGGALVAEGVGRKYDECINN